MATEGATVGGGVGKVTGAVVGDIEAVAVGPSDGANVLVPGSIP